MDYTVQLQSATSLAEIAGIARSTARQVTGADGATVVLRDGDLCYYVDEDAIAPLWKGQRFPVRECISGWAMLHRKTAIVADIELDPRIPLAAYRTTFVRSLAMAPIRVADPIGAIGAYWAAVREPAVEDVAALEQLAEHTAAAVDALGFDTAPWAPNWAVFDPEYARRRLTA